MSLGALIVLAVIAFFIILGYKNSDIEYLYIQKIKDSDYVIIDYLVVYGRDGITDGMTVLKSPENFNFRDVSIPFSYIQNVSPTGINSVEVGSPNQTYLEVHKKTTIDDFAINVTLYKYHPNRWPCMLDEYKFKSFKETKDSLYLEGLTELDGKIFAKNNLGFKKGNIKLISDEKGYLKKLIITELMIMEKDSTESTPACFKTIYMIPEINIRESEFSDYGFFKEYKEKIK